MDHRVGAARGRRGEVGQSYAPPAPSCPAPSGASSNPQHQRLITSASGYWIARSSRAMTAERLGPECEPCARRIDIAFAMCLTGRKIEEAEDDLPKIRFPVEATHIMMFARAIGD